MTQFRRRVEEQLLAKLRANPFPRGSYQAQYYESLVLEQESARDRVDLILGVDPEVREVHKEHTKAIVGQIEPDHGHLGINARIDLAQRDAMAARIREERGELREPDPEPEWRKVTVTHPEAGDLHLRTDGNGWYYRNRGTDFGVGDARRGELGDTLTPRAEVIAAAAARALEHPQGPQSPPGSPRFRSGPDGEPIEVTADDLAEATPTREPSTIERMRRRLAERKAAQE